LGTEARIGPMEGCLLLYFFDVTADRQKPPLDDLLRALDALVEWFRRLPASAAA
jgi:hypothetical protein